MSIQTQGAITAEIAAAFTPLSDLQPSNLSQLCQKARVSELPVRSRIYASEEHRWLTYLLDGSLDLVNGRAPAASLDAGSADARKPLFEGASVHAIAIAMSPVKVVRFEREQLRILMGQQQETGIEVSEFEALSDGDNQVFDDIAEAFAQKRLKVPTLPEVVLRIRKVLSKPDTDAREVSRVVQRDPVLTARLVQIANSPAYRGNSAVDSVHAALMRVGLKAMRNLALALAIKQLFHAKLPAADKRMRLFYSHAALDAARCCILARETPRLDAETAMLAALTHEIGVVPILAYADSRPEFFNDPRDLDRTIARLRKPISDWILSSWDFDPVILQVAEESRDWQRDSGSDLDYCDLVNAVMLHAYGQRGKKVPIRKLPMGRKLIALGLEVDDQIVLLEQRKQDVQILLRLLSQ
jgi:HD-like signal output (HDOD) protein